MPLRLRSSKLAPAKERSRNSISLSRSSAATAWAPGPAWAKQWSPPEKTALVQPGSAQRVKVNMSSEERKRLADPSVLADYKASLIGLRDRFGEVGLPSAVFFDFMHSLGEFVALSEGPASVVSWSIPSDESVPSLILFLEKGEKGYDIVAASGDLSDIARASMSLLSAGKTEDVRSWFVLLKKLDGSDSRLPNLSSFSFLSGLEPSKASAEEMKRAAALILCSSADPEDSKAGSSVIYPFWKSSTDDT